jgi:hypothetical protein
VVSIKASAMSSEPTTAENGNVRTSYPSCGCPRPRHIWAGSAYAGCDDDRRGRRPDFPILADDGSQWRDRSGLAPDSSTLAASMMSHPELRATTTAAESGRTRVLMRRAAHHGLREVAADRGVSRAYSLRRD